MLGILRYPLNKKKNLFMPYLFYIFLGLSTALGSISPINLLLCIIIDFGTALDHKPQKDYLFLGSG